MTTSAKPLIAYFGATGGCALNVITLALQAGYPAIALARTPSKLTKLLVEQQKVAESIVNSNLQIVKGSATDLAAVKEVLSHNAPIIISGIGGSPKLQYSFTQPVTIDQPDICHTFAAVMLTALRELSQEGKLTTKPFFVVHSTTGLTQQRDVPWLFYPLYHYFLSVPHVDKRIMEDETIAELLKKDSVLSGFSSVRASLLTDGAKLGSSSVRYGWVKHEKDEEFEDGPGPAIGYTISRADVGAWVFEQFIEGDATKWNRKMPTVTY